MKQLLYLILLTVFPLAADCQEKDNNFHFIEAGVGTGLSKAHNVGAAFSVALSNGLGKYMANFLDYQLFFDKSAVKHHEVSFKIGPCYQFGRYSYMALSAGASLLINATDDNWTYRNGYNYYEDSYQLSVPVQAKINIGLSGGLCIGLKGTFNKMVDKHNADRGSVLGYVAFGW